MVIGMPDVKKKRCITMCLKNLLDVIIPASYQFFSKIKPVNLCVPMEYPKKFDS